MHKSSLREKKLEREFDVWICWGNALEVSSFAINSQGYHNYTHKRQTDIRDFDVRFAFELAAYTNHICCSAQKCIKTKECSQN